MYDISIKICNYKCFKEEVGFDTIKRINLIIGRNNSGKSALLDIIKIATENTYKFDSKIHRDSQDPYLVFSSTIEERVIEKVFSDKSLADNSNNHHNIKGDLLIYGKKFIGKKIKWKKIDNFEEGVSLIYVSEDNISPKLSSNNWLAYNLIKNMPVHLDQKVFKRLSAERDIFPEKDSDNLEIMDNGSGLTNVIQNYMYNSDLPNHLVEKYMLNSLKHIYKEECEFTEITCERNKEGRYFEIYLHEEKKGKIPLSQSGSGLKTVIIVLSYLYLLPHMNGNRLNGYVFGFEELENNLHPSLLRKLIFFLDRKSVEKGFIFFLTTHSNVLIDGYIGKSDSQVLHVKHSNSTSTCTTVDSFISSKAVLDDLQFKASDLLQSNGIIWVEGPSDRIYLNKWISLWSDGDLIEGFHYQIAIYGGRLLSHFNGISVEKNDSISFFNLNKNSLILIDSDKKCRKDSINQTKERIQNEFLNMDSMCWITEGKEIENYIPSCVVNSVLGIEHSDQVGVFDNFFNHLEELSPGKGHKYEQDKVNFSKNAIKHMTRENLEKVLDLEDKLKLVTDHIYSWN